MGAAYADDELDRLREVVTAIARLGIGMRAYADDEPDRLREAWEDELAEEEADRAAEQVAWDRAAEAELQRREEM